MIKLFASDLDGTLLKDHVMDDTVSDAVRTLRENGRLFAIVTGRTMYPHQNQYLTLENYGVYCICLNGALILDPEGRELYRRELNRDFLAETLERFPDLMLECIGDRYTYIRQSQEAYEEAVLNDPKRGPEAAQRFLPNFLKTAAFSVSNDEIVHAGITKINARIADQEQAEKFSEYIASKLDYVANRPYESGVFEITALEASKGQAVAYLLERLGLGSSEVAVYGDGPNDLEMLNAFPLSFAPENAQKSAKAAASEVIGSCDNHAVPRHMLRMMEMGI